MMRIALLVVLSLPVFAQAQVYKCSGKSGETVYSQSPCAGDARPHVLRSGQLAGSNLRLDRQCLQQAQASIYAASNDRVAGWQQQIELLGSTANNRPRIIQLQQQIRDENASAKRQVDQARSDCLREPAPEQPAPPSTGQADT